MKYLIIQEGKEPLVENMPKINEIAKARDERREKGERLSMNKLTPIYRMIQLPAKSFYIVDCEAKQLIELIKDFWPVMNIEIIPVETTEEWGKI